MEKSVLKIPICQEKWALLLVVGMIKAKGEINH